MVVVCQPLLAGESLSLLKTIPMHKDFSDDNSPKEGHVSTVTYKGKSKMHSKYVYKNTLLRLSLTLQMLESGSHRSRERY